MQAQVELSYCGDIDQGFGDAGVIYTPYVQFEATTMTPYAGNYIKQVLVGMKADATNVTIYIKNAPRDTNPLYRQTVSEGLTEGWNVITLDTPFEIPEGKEIAKKTMKISKENIWFAIIVKTLILIMSILGITTMWQAVFADVGVTIIAVFNSLRALK